MSPRPSILAERPSTRSPRRRIPRDVVVADHTWAQGSDVELLDELVRRLLTG